MLSAEDRATATGNMHKKFGEIWPHVFRVMRADRQMHRQTDKLQYFETLMGQSNKLQES